MRILFIGYARGQLYDYEWITPSEIPNYDFCLADVEILKEITKRYE